MKEEQLFALVFASFALTFLLGVLGPSLVNLPSSFSSSSSSSSPSSSASSDYTSVDADTVADSLLNEILFYTEYTLNRQLIESEIWESIVEPYKVNTFEVSSPLSGYSYKWSLDGWHHTDGTKAEIVFTTPGQASTITVEAYKDETSELIITKEISVMCKYVRRELRNLNDQDRVAFFQAVSILQRVPTQVGKALYGKNYRSKDFFNRIHLYYGGSKSCDHWHQGPGFVTSHLTFSLLYEQALQSINPSVSLPYWDFTLESTLYEPDSFRSSGVFSNDWFGDAECEGDDHMPTAGRFAYVPTMTDASDFSLIVSPYGLLRSPWNSDPTPYLTRSSLIYNIENNLKPSGCAEYHHAMGFTTLKDLFKQLNSATHGHIHELIGGSWNPWDSLDTPNTNEGMTEAYEFAHSTEAYSKSMWRYDFLLCPEGAGRCNEGDSEDECQCVCTEESMRNYTSQHVLSATKIITSLVFYDPEGNAIANWQNKTTKLPYDALPGYSEEDTSAMYQEIIDVLCSPGYIGDMFQATSTNDVTFWILHPTVERLWHLFRSNTKMGWIDFDESWPDADQSCDGHFSYDTTPFKNIFDSDDIVYTNADLYDLLDPTQDSFPYVYDNFRWAHCTFLDYDMSGTELPEEAE